jgi:GNAT superfamily N-acetyltransferase
VPRSLAFETDLMVRRLAGSDIDTRDDLLVVRTPRNPQFYWGNFLLAPGPPDGEDASRWLATFATEFPDAHHVAIGVDGTDGDLGEAAAFRAAGLAPEISVVLVADHLVPVAPVDSGAVIRPLAADRADDWTRLVELEAAVADDPDDTTRDFVHARVAEIRDLVRDEHALWCAAFRDGMLCASLGLVTDGSGVGRYQLVQTHPDFRRRGLAGQLLSVAAAVARHDLGVERLVIVADPDYVAIDLYRRLGFADHEKQVQWQRASA